MTPNPSPIPNPTNPLALAKVAMRQWEGRPRDKTRADVNSLMHGTVPLLLTLIIGLITGLRMVHIKPFALA